MNELRHHAEDYLCVRRALGYKLAREGCLLANFVAYLEQRGARSVTTHDCVVWTRLATNAGPNYLAQRMRTARSFARYLSTIDSVSEIPPAALFPSRSHRPTPYIYRDDEIVALMDGARKLAPPIKAATLETLIGLLAATGMRVGETVSLEHRDVDWGEGLITVRHAKFNKSREVLLHSSVIAALERYAHQRDRLVASAPTFFVSSWGCSLSYKKVQPAFREVCNRVLENASCRPRLHDLRHSFAVNTLLSWYRDGGDVASRLPLLSTYLGHVDPAATYWYLSAVPELLNLAAKRLEQS